MASAAGYQIAREKYQARAAQAGLTYEVHRQEVLQAELQRSQHSQQALEAQISRTQHEAETQMAQEQLRYSESEFAANKVHILLQGFGAISSILHNIAWIASLLMGFTVVMYMKEKTGATGTPLKYTFWSAALTAVVMLAHSIFVSTLSLTDATKLAYQGTQGMSDLKRAFHGLMKRRAEVYWNFMFGFILFNCVIVMTMWVKLDQDEGKGDKLPSNQIVFGLVVSILYVVIGVARMLWSWSSIRAEFKIVGGDVGDAPYSAAEGRTGAEVTERDLIPRSHAAGLAPAPEYSQRPSAEPLASRSPAAAGAGDAAAYAAATGGGAGAAGGAPPAMSAGHPSGDQWEAAEDAGDGGDGDQYEDDDSDEYAAAAPPSAQASSRPSGIETAMTEAQWTPARHVRACVSCHQPFGARRRKHHCRGCGDVFCDACSCHNARLRKPGTGKTALYRVCTACVSAFSLRCECAVCRGARGRPVDFPSAGGSEDAPQ